MRQNVFPLLGLAGLVLASPSIAAPAMSKDGHAPAFVFPPMPNGSMPSDPPDLRIPGPRLRDTAGNPGITAPLVPPPAADAAAGSTPANPQSQADILNDLFKRLSASEDGTEASSLAQAIEHVWLESGSDTADLLMSRTVTAVGKGDTALATKLLDKLVVVDPTWAEAWNKRATLRFLSGDDMGAVDDISHVLTLEPRHFGALSGMGFILQRSGMKKQALELIRKAAAIYPHNVELEKVQSALILEVEGREI